jgi:hypothetical protein
MSKDNPRGLPDNMVTTPMPIVKPPKQEQKELFHGFRLDYMDEYLNKLNEGKAGREVLARLKTALEGAMVGGVDVLAIADSKIPKLVADLHAALTAEVATTKLGT